MTTPSLADHFYSSFKIKNDPFLGDLTIPSLKRINAIVGQNGAGKTAVLNAIEQELLQEGRAFGESPDMFPKTTRKLFQLLNDSSLPPAMQKLRKMIQGLFYVYSPSYSFPSENSYLPDTLEKLLDLAHEFHINDGGNAVFLDNIDSGIHPWTLDRLWPFLWDCCVSHKVQLFCTFYSTDCFRSLGEMMLNYPDRRSITLHRIEPGKGKKAISFDHEELMIAYDRELMVI